ncbi:MAG TPA: PilZ domain-containing protein [Candidatus Competibacteraceae bacterium]|nr:PilZ domain-containing protein [Candidatus Competibacteraceae bacterium]
MLEPKSPKQGVMSLTIRDKSALLAAYMPYVKNGGIFIPTERTFALGDEVFLLLSLLDEPQRYPVTGKVVWINPPNALGGRRAGIGIQFTGQEGSAMQKKIETYLAGALQSDRPSDTM